MEAEKQIKYLLYSVAALVFVLYAALRIDFNLDFKNAAKNFLNFQNYTFKVQKSTPEHKKDAQEKNTVVEDINAPIVCATPKECNNKGALENQAGHMTGAFKYFKRSTELDPNYMRGYLNMGINRFNVGNLDEAIKNFNKAIELNPDYPLTYFYRAYSYRKLSDMCAPVNKKGYLKRALSDIDTAIEKGYTFEQGYALQKEINGALENL